MRTVLNRTGFSRDQTEKPGFRDVSVEFVAEGLRIALRTNWPAHNQSDLQKLRMRSGKIGTGKIADFMRMLGSKPGREPARIAGGKSIRCD